MTHDLDADYAAAGFGGRLPAGRRPALLLIDVVMAYVQPDSPLYVAPEDALAAIGELVDGARSTAAPVVFTKVVYQPGGTDGGWFFRKVPALKAFEAGSPLGEFPPSLQPRAEDLVITKQYPSAFFGTSLAAALRSMDVDSIVMGGFSTSGCVRASALDTLQNGFIPFVARAGCADRDRRPHEANLFDLQAKYAEVISTPAALELFTSSAWREASGRLSTRAKP